MVPLEEAQILNFVELLTADFLLCLKDKEFHIFDVIELVSIAFFVSLVCHCTEGAKH